MRSERATWGMVHLVGAGPGSPDLITVKGLRLVQEAEVLIYDRLVHPALVDAAPEGTERVFVGKAPGRQMVPQEGIQELMIVRAQQGHRVVRLKGGDPFVFGRGGEESLALEAAGVAFEIVPGISSSVGVPAYAGIPVTHRGFSQGFSVFTGHAADHPEDAPDWPALASNGTLVVLMGLKKLPVIVSRLLGAGHPADTPAAVIAEGCTAQQQVVAAPLKDIVAAAAHLTSPATVVIGAVASLRDRLQWFDASAATAGAFHPVLPPTAWISIPTA